MRSLAKLAWAEEIVEFAEDFAQEKSKTGWHFGMQKRVEDLKMKSLERKRVAPETSFALAALAQVEGGEAAAKEVELRGLREDVEIEKF